MGKLVRKLILKNFFLFVFGLIPFLLFFLSILVAWLHGCSFSPDILGTNNGNHISSPEALRKLKEKTTVKDTVIYISEPGSYDEPGATFVLTQDITSERSAIFLGKDVTLDLNGHTITYAYGDYEHIPNHGFEFGLVGWDVSDAPKAKILDTDSVKPFIGKKILSLPAGEEIVSGYITLPVKSRSYYAMCGVLNQEMRITISVEDETGKQIRVLFDYRDGKGIQITCPEINRHPLLGGGFVLAHLHNLPSGRYRIRVKAANNCLIDEVDIRPAMDVGIGIVGKTITRCYYERIYLKGYDENLDYGFFDYTDFSVSGKTPISSIPFVSGTGTVTIKNGKIRSGFEGVASWGIQCTADDVLIVLENVSIISEGINANALSTGKAEIRNCRFELDNPYIIQRHWLGHSPVSLNNASGSEVSYSKFIGGQGCLSIAGNRNIRIHDNLFVNRQTATNHYSIMLRSSEYVEIYNNRFLPEIGSGILVFRSRYCDIHGNEFKIKGENGSCEYTNNYLTTAAIRIADYGETNPDRGAHGNKIYNNNFEITGKHYTNYFGFHSNVCALYVSSSARANYYYGNDIVVKHEDPNSPSRASAFYIGGSSKAGQYYDNIITTNVPAFWFATPYGNASNAHIYHNTIIKTPDALESFRPFKFGDDGEHIATNIRIGLNTYVNTEFGIEMIGNGHNYTVDPHYFVP
jgi:hypothetical protein